jgi:hypothetical protein
MSIYCSQLQIQGEKGLQAEKLPFLLGAHFVMTIWLKGLTLTDDSFL